MTVVVVLLLIKSNYVIRSFAMKLQACRTTMRRSLGISSAKHVKAVLMGFYPDYLAPETRNMARSTLPRHQVHER